MFPRPPAAGVCGVWVWTMREDKLGDILFRGASPAGVTSAPGRGWGDVLMVGPDAGAGRQVGPRGPRSGKVMGPLPGQFSPQIGPDQGGASHLSTAIARAKQVKSRVLNWPAVVDTG